MSMQPQPFRRAGLALGLAFLIAVAFSLMEATRRGRATRSRLSSAEQQLTALTDRGKEGDRRAAIAWGYSQQLRLGLESPFRLIDAAATDPRLTTADRRTVSWALLSHVLRGESHYVDAAALDQLHAAGAPGEAHLDLVEDVIANASDPRAAELAIRLAYTLAAAERRVEGIAPLLVAEAAALVADRELAAREARALLRSAGNRNPVELIQRRRARREFYVERPVLLAPTAELESAAIALVPELLERIRILHATPSVLDSVAPRNADVATRLFAAGARVPPDAPLAVTVQRYLPMLRSGDLGLDPQRLARAANAEMLIGALRPQPTDRTARRNRGRLLLAAAVAMRSLAQTPRWLDDAAPSADDVPAVAARLGLGGIDFDADVPRAWRPYYLQRLSGAMNDLRQVLPDLRLDGVRVRFRSRAPADSALAMHDPRNRTLHLPVGSAGGTLAHELAHDLDRQSALQAGLAGYRSDLVSRSNGARSSRVAASLRALTEELSNGGREQSSPRQRPAEVFATRVDWFVAQALAREGISNGFLSAVQDELLTGHVVHPERLRGPGRSFALITALEGMTPIAPSARAAVEPSSQTLLRWALAAPVERVVAAQILRGTRQLTLPCVGEHAGRASLVRLAAESRAVGWVRQRASWIDASQRPGWAHSALGNAPWSEDASRDRVAALRDHILLQLSTGDELPAGLGAYASSLAIVARCGR
jgi:hypothetical protein